MTIFLIDQLLRPIEALPEFVSLTWVERYFEYGEFELSIRYSYHLYITWLPDMLVSISDSDRLMVIEDVAISKDESFPIITFTGRSLEKVMTERYIFNYGGNTPAAYYTNTVKNYSWRTSGNLQTNILNMIRMCFVKGYTAGSYTDNGAEFASIVNGPAIQWMDVRVSTDPNVTSVSNADEGAIEELYPVVQRLLSEMELGFRMVYVPNEDYTKSRVYFEIFKGVDRSEAQSVNIPVIFSEDYQNLKSSRYYKTVREHRNNWGWVNGLENLANGDIKWGETIWQDPEDPSEIKLVGMGMSYWPSAFLGTYSWPLEMKFIAVEHTNFYDEKAYPDLTQAQREALSSAQLQRSINAHQNEEIFEAELIPNGIFQYGRDFFLGDIISINTEYGVRANARVTEVVRSYDSEGDHILPTFQIKEFRLIPDVETNPK